MELGSVNTEISKKSYIHLLMEKLYVLKSKFSEKITSITSKSYETGLFYTTHTRIHF